MFRQLVAGRLGLLVAAVAGLTVLLVAPSPAGAYVPSFQSVNCVELYTGDFAGPQYGIGCFEPSGEVVTVFDRLRDGHAVRAELLVLKNGVLTFRSVKDPDGAGPFFGLLDLSLAERSPVSFRVCVNEVGCSKYYTLHA